VNCEALAALQAYLPRTGTLFFFFETIHRFGGREGHSPCKVFYVTDNASLRAGKRFSFYEEEFFELTGGQYAPQTQRLKIQRLHFMAGARTGICSGEMARLC